MSDYAHTYSLTLKTDISLTDEWEQNSEVSMHQRKKEKKEKDKWEMRNENWRLR